jgi:hypothetical protein
MSDVSRVPPSHLHFRNCSQQLFARNESSYFADDFVDPRRTGLAFRQLGKSSTS